MSDRRIITQDELDQLKETTEFTCWLERDRFYPLGLTVSPFNCNNSIEYILPEDKFTEANSSSNKTLNRLSLSSRVEFLYFRGTDSATLQFPYYNIFACTPWQSNYEWVSLIFDDEEKYLHELQKGLNIWQTHSYGFWKRPRSEWPKPSVSENETSLTLDRRVYGLLKFGYTYRTEYLQFQRELDKKKLEPMDAYVYLSPKNYDATGSEMIVTLMPSDKDEVDCLMCTDMYSDNSQAEDLKFLRKTLTEKINFARNTHTLECLAPCKDLLHDDNLSNIMSNYLMWIFDNNAIVQSGNEDCEMGVTPSARVANNDGRDMRVGEMLYEKTIDGKMPDYSEVINMMFEKWAGNEDDKQVMYDGTFELCGFSMVANSWITVEQSGFTYTQYEHHRIIAGALIAVALDQSLVEYVPPVANLPCIGECLKIIEWRQGDPHKEGESKNEIIFPLKIPFICGMQKLLFNTETHHDMASLDIADMNVLKPIPQDSSLKFTATQWNCIFSLNTYFLVPGEYVLFQAQLMNYDGECQRLTIAWGWFETQCLSSGIVQGCGILDDQGNVLKGGFQQELTPAFQEPRLHWLISFKGNPWWIRPSDLTNYPLGTRAFVYKNGLSVFKNRTLGASIKVGCRNSGNSEETSPLSYNNVSYRIDRNQDCLIPANLAELVGAEE